MQTYAGKLVLNLKPKTIEFKRGIHMLLQVNSYIRSNIYVYVYLYNKHTS